VSEQKNKSWPIFVKQIIKPPQVYSWQTFILLSLISLSFALLSFGFHYVNGIRKITFVPNLIANFSFLFLIIGLSWLSVQKNLFFRSWLISGLICLFIFGNISQLPHQLGLILLPILASFIAIFPYFIDKNFKFHGVEEKHRLKVILIGGVHLMLSCWLQVYFVFNNWATQYPTLLADFSQSSLIINLQTQNYPRGNYWLKQIQLNLDNQLNNKQWFITQQWIDNAVSTDIIQQIKKQIIDTNSSIVEDTFWKLKIKIEQSDFGYNINLLAIWQGPKFKEKEYFCEKNCLLQPLIFSPDEPELTTTQFQCEPTKIQGWKVNSKYLQ